MQSTIAGGRDPFYDLTKGFLIVLVLLGHSLQYAVHAGGDSFWYDPLYKMIYMFHMPLFIVISGVLGAQSLARHSLEGTFRRRLWQLVVPLISWGFLTTILLTGFQIFRHKPISLTQLPFDLLASIWSGYWYLWALFFSTLAVGLLHYFRWDNLLGLAILSLAAVILPIDHAAPVAVRSTATMVLYLVPFYCAGHAIASMAAKRDRQADRRLPNAAALAITIAIAVAAYSQWDKQTYIYVSGMDFLYGNEGHVLLRLAGSSAACYIVWAMMRFVTSTTAGGGQLLQAFGRNSLGIYLAQGPVFMAVYVGMKYGGSQYLSQSARTIMWFAAPVAAFALCYILHVVIMAARKQKWLGVIFFGDARATVMAPSPSGV